MIDDDPAAIEIAAAYLGREGYAVYGLTDSRNVLDEARTFQPSVILLDVLMPHKEGWEVLAELKADPELRAIPVALYTVAEEQKLGLNLGASAYLVKPVNAEQLRTTVARLVAENTTVLIIDDDPNIRKVVTKHIQLSNAYRVMTADGGQAGLDQIAATRPDLIILDLMMPEVDGFAILDKLAQQPHTRDIPVIVFTAKELTDQERETLDQSADGLFTKGAASSEQLLNRVRTLLGPATKPVAPVPQAKE